MPEVSLSSKYFNYWANEFLIGYHSFDLTFLSLATGRVLKGRYGDKFPVFGRIMTRNDLFS